ncbi:hypothetical protein R75777_07913 [Paraburkholderia nemoris]|nr:hypothetical protein R75777_07913 [Paraburkholderia nemoris]
MREQQGEIVAVKTTSHCDQLATDAPEDATCGLSLAHAARQVTLNRCPRRQPCVPGTQRSQRVSIGKAVRCRRESGGGDEARFHDIEFSPETLPQE